MFYHILVILFAVLMLCTQKSHAIPNGQEIDSRKRPEIVRLLLYKIGQNKELLENGTCTGTAISDYLVLTAGHCVTGFTNEQNDLIVLHQFDKNGKEHLTKALNTYTEYIAEDFKKIKDEQNEGAVVPGCVAKQKPIIQSKTPDLALVKFPRNTFKKTAQINLSKVLSVNDSVEFYGFGAKVPYFESAFPTLDPHVNDLRVAQNKIWRTSENRSAIISAPSQAFADVGDSGGPVFFNNEVVGVLSMLDEKCETAYGDDFAVMNTPVNLSSLQALDFFTRAVEALSK